MFQEVTMFKLTCNRCGKDAGRGGVYTAWDCKEGFDDMFDECGWITVEQDDDEMNDKHYCPDCWYCDDEDYIQIKGAL